MVLGLRMSIMQNETGEMRRQQLGGALHYVCMLVNCLILKPQSFPVNQWKFSLFLHESIMKYILYDGPLFVYDCTIFIHITK